MWPVQSRSNIQQEMWVSRIAPHALDHIFSYLDPVALSRSACTCAFWRGRAEQECFYRAFSDLVPYYKGRIENLKDFCVSRRFAPHCRLPILPPQEQFENPFESEDRLFPGFQYDPVKMQAYIYLGGERKDLVFLLACYFGDSETAKIAFSVHASSQQNVTNLMHAALFAVLGDQVEVFCYLKTLNLNLEQKLELAGVTLRMLLNRFAKSDAMKEALAATTP